jgi:hypothetical protein
LVELLKPPVAWAFFAFFLLLAGSGLANTFTLILASAPATLAPVWAVALPSAGLLGAALSAVEHTHLKAVAELGVTP